MFPSKLHISLALSAVALALPAAASARVHHHTRAGRAVNCVGADSVPTAGNPHALQDTTLCLLNNERAAHGLGHLVFNVGLDHAARMHSFDMVDRHYFDHVTPAGADPVARLTKVHYITKRVAWTIGEDLGWGSGSASTPRQVVAAWMASPPHRANILMRGFRDVGIGVALGAPEAVTGPAGTYTIDFGRRS